MPEPKHSHSKLRLQIGIEVLQKYGRAGTIVADRLLKKTPTDSPDFNRDGFINEIKKLLLEEKNETQ